MKFLIASLGDFERWKEVKYRFGEETSVGPSTLTILQKHINPDWTVIVLSDTIGKDFSSLEALREDIKNRVLDFLDRIGAGREVDIIIVPGIGEFSHGTFKGSAMDTYYYLLYNFVHILPTSGPIEVHFDITHGLNYITLLVYRALKELLGILAIGDPVRFVAYNSDPFVQGVTKELTINVIEEGRIEPQPLSESLPDFNKYIFPNSNDKKDIGKRNKELKNKLKVFKFLREKQRPLEAWIGSVVLGLPLMFIENFPDKKELEEVVEEVLNEWENAIEISDKLVQRTLKLERGFGVLEKILFQVKVLEKYLPQNPPSIDNLYKVSNQIFRGATKERVNTELGKIEDRAIKYVSLGLFPDWMLLRDFFWRQDANRNIVRRNLLAHAGFEMNVAEVKIEGWKVKDANHETRNHVFLRYCKNVKRNVEIEISKALKEGL